MLIFLLFRWLNIKRRHFDFKTTVYGSKQTSQGWSLCAHNLQYRNCTQRFKIISIIIKLEFKQCPFAHRPDSSNFNQTDEYFQWSASILLAANKSLTRQSTLVNISLQNIKVGEEQGYLLAYYSLTLSDNIDFSPFEQWKSMGKPVQPSLDQVDY